MGMNMMELLRDRAAATPDATAFTFLDGGEQEGASLTWEALELRSRALGAAVAARIPAGGRVLVMLPPGVDFVPAFFGVLFAGGIALPSYPPAGARPDRTSDRLRGMIADAAVSLVVSCKAVRSSQTLLEALVPELAGLPWLCVDEVDPALADAWRVPRIHADSVALLQYTSGSTGSPRGVMVTHANLLHNLGWSARLAGHDRQSVGVSWLPVNHDMGLIDGILQPVFSGFQTFLMAPASFLQRPARWLQAISRYGATHSGGPNFAYDLCARRISDDDRAALDLSTWRIAYNGSEPVRRSTLEHFHRAFATCGFKWEAFRPAYGLAESTLLVASNGPDEGPAFTDAGDGRSLVSCGRVGDESVRIVDPASLLPVHDGAVGEIWVTSESVAAGYWNRSAETAATFHARLANSQSERYLRSGDLGCIVDRRLYVTGRIKDILIVRGVKHYPQDLEATAERAHPALRPGCCAAFAIQQDGEERVALVAEVDRSRQGEDPDLHHAVQSIRRSVAEAHQVSLSGVALVPAGTLPKTTSGKLQRFLCRDGFVNGHFETLAAAAS